MLPHLGRIFANNAAQLHDDAIAREILSCYKEGNILIRAEILATKLLRGKYKNLKLQTIELFPQRLESLILAPGEDFIAMQRHSNSNLLDDAISTCRTILDRLVTYYYSCDITFVKYVCCVKSL